MRKALDYEQEWWNTKEVWTRQSPKKIFKKDPGDSAISTQHEENCIYCEQCQEYLKENQIEDVIIITPKPTTFIFDIETNEKNVHFVELILGIARNLHVPVIAEGVETIEQLKILKNLGCDIIQGYYFSKPIPALEFEEKFLKK